MKLNVKKLVVSGMLTALAVALSTFSVPIGASKCFPIQHMVNVMAGVFLGPVYGVAIAFCTSLIRNLMGTGSLLAFPGSMVGGAALRTGLPLDRKTDRRLCVRDHRHRYNRSDALLSGCGDSYGKRGRPVFLCGAVFDEHAVRNGHRGDSERRSLPFRRVWILKTPGCGKRIGGEIILRR